jgi:glycosyltransferase involved in cell wall biosynthesis
MRLLAAMIVRDEAARYLPRVLASLQRFCDTILILDDGSTDNSVQVGNAYGALVRSAKPSVWQTEGEGAARNRLLELTLRYQPAPDWVLSIDADEFVADGPGLRRFLETVEPDEYPAAVSLTMKEVWEGGPDGLRIRVDGEWGPRECPVLWTPPSVRLDASERFVRGWSIPERALACGREPEIVRFATTIPSGYDLLHYGWADPYEREARAERYEIADGGRYHASEHLRSILGREPELEAYRYPR